MERHYTIGIAGHVDHGKTTLVAALSGVDTDRMKAEKERGLSIEFGIAPLLLPSGRQVSLVDVPGHRDYMKNTLRGLSAVDAAILMVAANDGVMPQTREHLEILRFFDVKTGFSVLSKADLVDRETLEMAILEVQDLLKGSFFEDGPVIPFSCVDGRGRDEIIGVLDSMAFTGIPDKHHSKPFRLFIDQIRIFQGLGTVVSGTILSGSVRRGDRLEILPLGKTTRVRSLEVHHRSVEEAAAGSRVGINLQGISAKELSRGMVLSAPGSFRPAEFLNAEVELCAMPGYSLRTGQRVKVHIGSAVVGAFAVIMGRDRLAAGERGLVQFRLMEPIGAAPLDRYVVTQMNTPSILGGGKILETTSLKFRRARAERLIPYLMEMQTGDPRRILKAALTAHPRKTISAKILSNASGLESAAFERPIHELVKAGDLLPVGAQSFLAAGEVKEAKREILSAVEKALAADPFRDQVGPSQIAAAIPWNLEAPVLDFLLQEMVREGVLSFTNGGYAPKDPDQRPGIVRDPLLVKVLEALEASGTVSVTVGLVCEVLGLDEEKAKVRRLLIYLVSKKQVVMLGNERYISRRGLEHAKERVRTWISEHGRLLPADCNPVLGCGRTTGLPVLEHLDSIGFTVRRGNERVPKE